MRAKMFFVAAVAAIMGLSTGIMAEEAEKKAPEASRNFVLVKVKGTGIDEGKTSRMVFPYFPLFMANYHSENKTYCYFPFLLSGFESCDKEYYLKQPTPDGQKDNNYEVFECMDNKGLSLPLLTYYRESSKLNDKKTKNEKEQFLYIFPLLSSYTETSTRDISSGKDDEKDSETNLLVNFYLHRSKKYFYDDSIYLFGLFRYKEVYEKWDKKNIMEIVIPPNLIKYTTGENYQEISFGPLECLTNYVKDEKEKKFSFKLLWGLLTNYSKDLKEEKFSFLTSLIYSTRDNEREFSRCFLLGTGYAREKASGELKFKILHFLKQAYEK